VARQAIFCNQCGTPFVEAAAFCSKCGASRPAITAASTAPPGGAVASTATPAAAATFAAPVFSAATIGGLAGAGALATALPWQTIVAGETPDLRAMLAAAASPAARSVVQASLRSPGVSLAVTTTLDLVVAGLSGGAGALTAALPRAVAGGVSALLAIVTGRKGGAMRTVTGIVSLVTALVQAGSLLVTLIGGLLGGASLLTVAPMALATGSALTMAVKTASVALRRPS
jgi:hypothetical protein